MIIHVETARLGKTKFGLVAQMYVVAGTSSTSRQVGGVSGGTNRY